MVCLQYSKDRTERKGHLRGVVCQRIVPNHRGSKNPKVKQNIGREPMPMSTRNGWGQRQAGLQRVRKTGEENRLRDSTDKDN